MPTITLSVPEDLKREMDKSKEINWSEVARSAIKTKVVTNGSVFSLMHFLTCLPIQESVGSYVKTTSSPFNFNSLYTSFDIVDLPEPSIPSNVTKRFI